MIEQLSYIISTCAGYEVPLSRLLASMPTAAHVLIVSGGEKGRRSHHKRNRSRIDVTHTSYDYTALIELIEHPWRLSDHVFLLHDTMEMGRRADDLIRQADPAHLATAVWGGECNLGLYRADYLHSRGKDILALKDCTKLQAVEAEGFLWRQLPEDQRGTYDGIIHVERVEPVYGGMPRQRISYAGVDIVKWKANWGQSWPPAVVTP
jgi:hypothetical protein